MGAITTSTATPGRGYRNGVRPGRLKISEGFITYSAPQIAGREEPFRSEIREHLKGRTQALEDLAVELLARGLSVRDTEDAFRDETGRLLLSKTAVSQLSERLWADYQGFASRDLSEYDIVYLLVAEPAAAHVLEEGAHNLGILLGAGHEVQQDLAPLGREAPGRQDWLI
ncbi:MAG: transposase [Proteobacteria bacterium]|nr:transposase [Pseudomonadota bacterium]